MSRAQQGMQQAALGMRPPSPGGSCSSAQSSATQALQQAQREIDRRLAELGVNPEDEAVERLETIFQEMLAAQQLVTQQTGQVAELLAANAGELRRADRITLRRLAHEERELTGRAAHALELIQADGTTVSFPIVVAEIRETLTAIADRLDELRLDEPTPQMQQDVETALAELIEALQQALKGPPRPPGKGRGIGGKPCLLPDTAELKMLRALQLRINRRTATLDARQPGAPDRQPRGELTTLAEQQRKLDAMVLEIISRNQPVRDPLVDPFPWLRELAP
jgi:hypothetical protein